VSERLFQVLGELTRKAHEANAEAREAEHAARKEEREAIVAWLNERGDFHSMQLAERIASEEHRR
jgi:hypothetical protein